MDEERLSRLLRELPRERAHEGFTARLLGRIEAAPARARRSPRQLPRPMLAAAALAALAALAAIVLAAGLLRRNLAPDGGAPQVSAVPPMSAASVSRGETSLAQGSLGPAASLLTSAAAAYQVREELRELRSEQSQLERELRQLRRPAAAGQPQVIYLGGDEDLDLVLDTRRVRARPGPIGAAFRRGGSFH